MDFFSIVLFYALYIIRPQEWLPQIEVLRPVSIAIYLSIFSMFFRERGFSFKNFIKTPHDVAMVAFFLWIVCTGQYWRDDYEKIKSQFLFYFLVIQALSSIGRLEKFMAWWSGLLVLIAVLAVASEYGFDPANSYENTHGMFKGRLVFHNALFNNPNGLGHGVVPAVGMVYFFCFWKRPIFIKEVGLLLLIVTLYCVYLTESKGAFIAGFAAIVTTLCFGRHKTFQVLVLVLSLTVGLAALKALPRMQDMSAPRRDAGIRGRLDAFRFGLIKLQQHRYGIGLFTFAPTYQKEHGIYLSPHSSYVGMGAELGWMGLFFYLAPLYCSLRVLVTAKTTTPEEERVRRILMVLNISFMVSTWMINWGHQATYWFICAVTAAFHRHLLSKDEPAPTVETMPAAPPFSQRPAAPAGVVGVMPPTDAPASVTSKDPFQEVLDRRAQLDEKPKPKARGWRRIGIVDLALIWLMTHYTVEFWSYIVKNL